MEEADWQEFGRLHDWVLRVSRERRADEGCHHEQGGHQVRPVERNIRGNTAHVYLGWIYHNVLYIRAGQAGAIHPVSFHRRRLPIEGAGCLIEQKQPF